MKAARLANRSPLSRAKALRTPSATPDKKPAAERARVMSAARNNAGPQPFAPNPTRSNMGECLARTSPVEQLTPNAGQRRSRLLRRRNVSLQPLHRQTLDRA